MAENPADNVPATGATGGPRHARLARAFAGVAAACVACLSLIVLAGWALDVEVLKSFLHPDPVAMNPLTAVAFLLCAASLWLQRNEPAPGPAARTGGRGRRWPPPSRYWPWW